jgi:hypothetical protein
LQSVLHRGYWRPPKRRCRVLSYNNGKWEIAYTERGKRSDPTFSTADKQEAIRYYYDHVIKQQHWHLVVFTRIAAIATSYKEKLERLNLKVIENDIPNYKVIGDRIFRLFVVNKDIFIAKEKIETLPYFDDDLKRY